MVKSQADDPISFLQLFTKADQTVAENQFEVSLLQAIGSTGTKKEDQKMSSKLNKVSSCGHKFFSMKKEKCHRLFILTEKHKQ